MNLNRVILSWPTLLSAPTAEKDTAPRTWIQIARTGSFTSNRYGRFSITKDDLAQMLHNFRYVTPKAPTELPVDVDHLSMSPQKPGDGIAAGWMKQLELRASGDELWAEVEWTPQGAEWIAKKEYRFISPSFVKDHTHKDGRKIGTTLLAAAICNHPFLEGMQALTLYNFAAMGDLALQSPPVEKTASQVQHLAEIGQRVGLMADPEKVPEVNDAERGMTYLVKAIVGEGDDQFVRVTTLTGEAFGWFRATQLAPAPAEEENTIMQNTTETDIEQKAAQFSARVAALSHGRDAREAMNLAAAQDAEGAEAYRLAGIGATQAETAPATTAITLSVRADESFDALCLRYSVEKGIPLKEAIHAVSLARPVLAAARG